MGVILIGLLFIGTGIFCFLGAKNQWGFFVRDRKYRRMARLFGENGTRIFYMGLGIFVSVMGLISIFGGINLV